MKKTVANRRMFRQGGAVNSGPTGILASSPSLIDAVAQDAMNVQGGPTVRMADGGIVRKMSTGGMAARQRLIGTRTPQIIRGTGSSLTPPDLDPRAIGLLPAEQLFLETDPERTIRIFDPKLRAGQAGMDVTTPAGETTSPIGRAIYNIGRFVSPVRDLAQRVAGAADVATQKQSPNLTDDDLYFFGLLEKTQPGANQSKIIRDMIERRPDLQTEIMSLSKQAVASSPNIGRDDLMNVVAKGLDAEALDKADRAMLEGYGLDPDAMVQVPGYRRAYPQRIFTELEEESDVAGQYPGGREDFIDQEFAKDVDLAERQLGPTPSDPGQDDTLGEEDIQDPNIASEASQDEFADPMGKERRAKAQGRRFPLPPRKPDVEDPNIAGGSQNEIEALGTPADAKDAAEQVRQTFDKPDMKPEETKRGMEYYLDQFKGAVPKYEGMSESEKGMLIAEAGLRVMAGQSPQAIENIAKGLQGVSKEFIADKKAKRAYDQQINLSAAKYALQAVRKDEEREAALAKEGRGLKTVVWTEDVMGPDGKLRGKKGTAGFITNDEIHSGLFDGQFEAGVTLAQERLKNKGKKADSILRKMIGQTKKGGQSDKFFNESLKEYRTSSLKLSDYATQLALVDSSLKISQDGKVTGLGAYVNRKINGLYNAFNAGRGENDPKVNSLKDATDSDIDALDTTDARKQRLKSIKRGYSTLDKLAQEGRDSQQFFAQQQELANLLIKEILGEGSKNISNIDRDLAQQIVGLYSDFGSITADPTIISQRLGRVRQRIIKNYENETNVMRGIEDQFNTSIDRDMRNVRETYFLPIRRSALGQVSASLGTPARQKPAVGPQGQKLYSFSVENGKRVYRFN